MNTKDTIIAPATPVGEGGISIVRVSGSDSLQAVQTFFRPKSGVKDLESHRLYYGNIVTGGGEVIDEVMVVYMTSPHSYTAEDVVEIQCHGNRHIVKCIVDLFIRSGLRLAEPGEFTYRAYLNGRIDLSQAEAVSRLIHSSTDISRRLALAQIDGALSQRIYKFSALLKKHLVFIEAWIDFPEEDLPEEDLLQISAQLDEMKEEISLLSHSFNSGRVFNEGVNLVLVGRPNVGKSSLMNALLGEDRAIVTDIPGTTRDILEDGIVLGDIPVRIFDTAGLRDSSDPVEREGIKRAEKKLQAADLILVLIDSSMPLSEEDHYILQKCAGLPHLIVFTKSDLPHVAELKGDDKFVNISVKSSDSIKVLEKTIFKFFVEDENIATDTVLVSEQRHYDALVKSSEYIDKSIYGLRSGLSLEFLAFELREALSCLGTITGQTTTEDILDDIFSGFCIGK